MNDCIKKAMDYLARREHSSHQLANKLARKGFLSSDIAAAIQKLQTSGLQSDQLFAEQYTAYRSRSGFGPLRVAAELKIHGIAVSLIESSVWHSGINWGACMQCAWRKKYSHKEIFGSKAYAGQVRFLKQRGFLDEEIQRFFQHS